MAQAQVVQDFLVTISAPGDELLPRALVVTAQGCEGLATSVPSGEMASVWLLLTVNR